MDRIAESEVHTCIINLHIPYISFDAELVMKIFLSILHDSSFTNSKGTVNLESKCALSTGNLSNLPPGSLPKRSVARITDRVSLPWDHFRLS